MAPGGIYVRQGGTPANPYSYELLPSIVDHKHHMAAYCGICIYQGNNFPDEYRGHVFMGNIHQNAVNHDRLVPNGSSFKALPDKDFLTTTDGWFRPVSEQVGPDGALWVADWYDKYPCYQNAQADPEGVDREHGRVWRVVHTGANLALKIGSRPDSKMDLRKLGDQELVSLLKHPNVWQRRMAQKLLAERSGGGHGLRRESEELEAIIVTEKAVEMRLAALWALHGIVDMTAKPPDFEHNWLTLLNSLTQDSDPNVKSWAVRFLAEVARFKTGPDTE